MEAKEDTPGSCLKAVLTLGHLCLLTCRAVNKWNSLSIPVASFAINISTELEAKADHA